MAKRERLIRGRRLPEPVVWHPVARVDLGISDHGALTVWRWNQNGTLMVTREPPPGWLTVRVATTEPKDNPSDGGEHG